MRAWASVLAAAAVCTALRTAAADPTELKKPLHGRSMQNQRPVMQMQMGFQRIEMTPQLLPTTQTPPRQSLSDSETALCAEEGATHHEAAKRPSLVRDQKPHRMLQLPEQVRFSGTQLSSQLSTQMPANSPPQQDTQPQTPAKMSQLLQMTSSKPPIPESQSLPDSKIQPSPQPRSELSGDSSLRSPPVFPSQPPSKLPVPPTAALQARPPQELPKQPLSELPTHQLEESSTRPPPKLPSQLFSQISTQPLQELPKTSLPELPTRMPSELRVQSLQKLPKEPPPALPKVALQESTQQTLELATDLSKELPTQPPRELTTRQPSVVLNSSSLSPSQQPLLSFQPDLQALPQPTTHEPSQSSQQSSNSSPISTIQSLQTSSTLHSPQSSQIPPTSSPQTLSHSTETPSQSSTETHPPQLTPSPPPPLTRTPDSGKKCNCFHELPRRRWLDCSNRDRNTIRKDDLCFVFPTHVNLSHNSFVSMPENLGEDVRSLNLSHNIVTTIPRSPPLHPRIHTLDLSFNRITNSSDELEDMDSLTLLYVQRNSLQSLNFLPKACSLRTLVAHHNQLRNMDGPLINCFMMVELDLSWNKLSELSKPVIGNFFFLRRLHLVHSGLTSIPPGVFGRSVYLKFLDLSENKLTTLPSRVFDDWLIETILLDKNIISSLPNDTFSKRYPYSIKKISLAQNKLKTIPRELFSELKSLEHLNLNYNYLRYLPNGIFDGLNLTEIGLRTNLLENLPPRLFSGLKNLKRIDLGGNQLPSVPGDLLADLSNLELLDLSDNLLSTVPAGLFNGVKSIEVLDLSLNLLSTFSGSQLVGLDHVEWLYLKGNQLKELPVFDAKWPQVMNFNIEKNHIEELSEAAVRSWLGDGSQERRVTLGGRQRLRSVASLRWVVDDPHVTAIVDAADCRCGFVNRGRAHLFFCASVSCPAGAANWVDEASHTDNQQ